MPENEPAHHEPEPAKSDAPATYIPEPPTPAESDQLSEAQALITDEWGNEPPGEAAPEAR